MSVGFCGHMGSLAAVRRLFADPPVTLDWEKVMFLVTGFEPFTTGEGLVLDHNPTAEMALRLADEHVDVVGAVLPVSFAQTRQALTSLWETHQPERWIGLGFAPHRRRVDVETVALNVEHAVRGDNAGERPTDRAIIEGAPLAYRTRVDTGFAADLFVQYGVEAGPGFHAGTFLCNQTFYLGCHRVEMGSSLRSALFIHVPPMEDYAPFSAALQALVTALAEGGID